MKRSLIALALAALLPLSAQAQELNYNFIELDYSRASIDEVDSEFEPDGLSVKGSVAVGEQFYLFGSYLRASESIEGVDLDLDMGQVGIGFRHGISERSDLIAELSYIDMNVDASFEDEEVSVGGNGYRASTGVRGLLSDNVEGYLKANWTDGSDVEGEFSGTIGGLFKINPTWGITAEAEIGDGVTIWGLGVRASF